jgi:predicted XRE-type DNA-binding protein
LSKDHLDLARDNGDDCQDFARPDANLEQARAIIAGKIICILKERELSMSSAAKVAGVPRSDLSRIRNKQLERFRLDRLIVILGKLDEDVEVNVTFTSRKHGHHLA